MLYNVVCNAFDAMSNGGTLSVDARLEGNSVILEFPDTGIGIPEENQERIFEPFFTTKPPGHGTGLGLSVSKSIIQRYGGHIKVRSMVGEGTSIVIELPIYDETHESK